MTAQRTAAPDARGEQPPEHVARDVPGWVLFLLAAGVAGGWVFHAHASVVAFDAVASRTLAAVPLLALGIGASFARVVANGGGVSKSRERGVGAGASLLALALPMSQLAVASAAPVLAVSLACAVPGLLAGGLIVTALERSENTGWALAWLAAGAALGVGLAPASVGLLGSERALGLAAGAVLPAALAFGALRSRPGRCALGVALLGVAVSLLVPRVLTVRPAARSHEGALRARASELASRNPDGRFYLERVAFARRGLQELSLLRTSSSLDAFRSHPAQALVLLRDGRGGVPVLPTALAPRGAIMRDFLERSIFSVTGAPGPPRNVLVLGLGGGIDVQAALRAGAERVVVVEPDSVSRELLTRVGVSELGPAALEWRPLHARAFLAGSDELFARIVIDAGDLAQVFDPAAAVLQPTSLLTAEALDSLLDHLESDGTLAIRHFGVQLSHRLVALARDALERHGTQPPEHALVLLRQGSWRVLLVRATPFPEQELQALRSSLRDSRERPHSSRLPGFDWLGLGFSSPLRFVYAPPPIDVARTRLLRRLASGVAIRAPHASDERPYLWGPEGRAPTTGARGRLRRVAAALALLALATGVGLHAVHRRRRTVSLGPLLGIGLAGGASLLFGAVWHVALVHGSPASATMLTSALLAGVAVGAAASTRIRGRGASVAASFLLLCLAAACALSGDGGLRELGGATLGALLFSLTGVLIGVAWAEMLGRVGAGGVLAGAGATCAVAALGGHALVLPPAELAAAAAGSFGLALVARVGSRVVEARPVRVAGVRLGWRARVGLVAFGLGMTLVLLGVCEAALRIAGIGEGAPGYDPLQGFSASVPLFTLVETDDGQRRYRVSPVRLDEPAASEVEPLRSFAAEKPRDGFRVFVVGGSSAAGVPYGPELAFSGWLARRLDAALPDREVEVVNAAISGYGSRRILLAVREIVQHAPDLLLIYSGHNEWAERRFYGDLIDRHPVLVRLQEAVYRTRLFTLLSRLRARRAVDAEAAVERFAEDPTAHFIEMFAETRRLDDSGYATVEQRASRDRWYRSNIEEMARLAEEVGSAVGLMTLSQNFADWPPAASLHRTGLSDRERADWQAAFERGRRAAAQGRCEQALPHFEHALAIDGEYADVHYQLARCLQSLARPDDARARYRLASDLDRVPHGAPTHYNATLVEIAAERGALLVDVDAVLTAAAVDGLVGDGLFADFVHPNVRAHQLIAEETNRVLRAASLPSPPGRWRQGGQPEPVAHVYQRDPELRWRERVVYTFGCMLARRTACVRAGAEALAASDSPYQRLGEALLERGETMPERLHD